VALNLPSCSLRADRRRFQAPRRSGWRRGLVFDRANNFVKKEKQVSLAAKFTAAILCA
jgi:hypothetical protein